MLDNLWATQALWSACRLFSSQVLQSSVFLKPYTNSHAQRLRSAYLRMHRVSNRIFRPFGVTADQYVVLRFLTERDGINQQDLGDQCASDPTTIGRMLELLEAKNYIERKVSPTDRRVRLVYLTESGRQLIKKLFAAATDLRCAMDQAMSSAEMENLLAGLEKLDGVFRRFENPDSSNEENAK